MKDKYIFSWLVVMLTMTSGLAHSDTNNGELFEVSGLQLAISPPEGWSAVWMSGDPDGQYFIEYLPEGDDVNSWRDGYIYVQRTAFTQDTLDKIERAGYSMLDFAFESFQYNAKITCPGMFFRSKPERENINNLEYVLGAGYCDKYGDAAPYGESTVFAYAWDGEFLFNVKLAWRPHSKDDQLEHPHWPIPQERVAFTFDILKSAFLCGGDEYEECPSLTGDN